MQSDPNLLSAHRRPVRLRSWRIRADDIDEAAELLRRDFGDHAQSALGCGPLRFELSAVAGLRALSGHWSTGIGQLMRASASVPVLHLPMMRPAEYRVGRRQLGAAPDVGIVLAPGHEYLRRTPPGRTRALWLEPELLAEAMEQRTPGHRRVPRIDSVELRLGPAEIAHLRRLIRAHGQAVRLFEAGAEVSQELACIERRLAAWMADQLLANRGVRASSAASMLAAEEIDDWIRAHLAETITLDRLAAVAGMSGRGLQKACLLRWGLSPMELLTSRRLDAVRRRLSAGTAGLTVTQAAIQCGFTHLGRFTVAYKSAFGESPSRTLARFRGA
jgi:AraC-like DNA-binding protein